MTQMLLQEHNDRPSPISSQNNADPVLSDEPQVDSDSVGASSTPSIESFLCPICEQPLLNLENGGGSFTRKRYRKTCITQKQASYQLIM